MNMYALLKNLLMSKEKTKDEAFQTKSLITKTSEYLQNAYRVLGLSTSASQEEIHEAKGAIGRALKIGISKSTNWDLLWLGPLSRSEKDLQSAMAKLTNPAQRLQERLFWFSEHAKLLNGATSESLPTAIRVLETNPNIYSIAHDIALAKLAYANLTDPGIKNQNLWIEVINLWQRVIDSDDYWALLLDMERDGRFEPHATTQEMEKLRNDAYRLVCSGLLALAKEGVIRENDAICRDVFIVLRESKLPRDIFYKFEDEVLGGLEDEFNKLCKQISDDSKDGFDYVNVAPENIETCTTALNRFDNEIQPFLDRLLNLSGENTEMANRVNEEAAKSLRTIAINFTWADESIQYKELLERAETIVPKESPVYHQIIDDLGGIEKHDGNQQVWKDLKPIKSAPTLGTINGCGFTIYGNTDYDTETESHLATYYFVLLFIPVFPICRYRVICTGDRGYRFLGKAPLRKGDKWHLGIILSLILVAFVWICANSYSSNRNSSTYSSDYRPSQSDSYEVKEELVSDTYSEPAPNSEAVSQENHKNELKTKIEEGRERLDTLKASLTQLVDEISNLNAELTQKLAELKFLKESLSKLDIDVEEYNEDKIASINEIQQEYESRIQKYNRLVEKHNRKVSEAKRLEQKYNTILEEAHRMVQEYNSL